MAVRNEVNFVCDRHCGTEVRKPHQPKEAFIGGDDYIGVLRFQGIAMISCDDTQPRGSVQELVKGIQNLLRQGPKRDQVGVCHAPAAL
jgi:hypothetical protein